MRNMLVDTSMLRDGCIIDSDGSDAGVPGDGGQRRHRRVPGADRTGPRGSQPDREPVHA
jgi:hypothetical protein